MKHVGYGVTVEFNAFHQLTISLHPKSFHDPVERFQQRAGAGEAVATKDAFARLTGNRLSDVNFSMIALTSDSTTLRIHFDDSKGLEEFARQ